ncbi:ankyrin repeat domain-containing protein [Arthrobacter sp. B1805]|uniref:ankyrin repeat domain-containing protein n=1 Tax=Arthrobacter sp. B1805 TaxID=2058892 RepID=UPI002157DA58|nr:ankyrin repeat domain-containing protein [Arthrobacter sp. B1805]
MVLIDKLIDSFVTQAPPRGAIRGVQAEVKGYGFGREGAGKMNETTAKPDFTDAELQFLDSVFELAREGHTGELMSLVSSGIPVNLTNSRGDTLLILAAYHRRADTVSALLSASADTSRVNDMGQTALAAATFRCDAGIVSALLLAGADPHLGSQSAVAVAQQFGLTDMATLFT